MRTCLQFGGTLDGNNGSSSGGSVNLHSERKTNTMNAAELVFDGKQSQDAPLLLYCPLGHATTQPIAL
jgi:hypothetical protein